MQDEVALHLICHRTTEMMKVAVWSEQVNDGEAIAIRDHRLSFRRRHDHYNRSESLEDPVAEVHLAVPLPAEG